MAPDIAAISDTRLTSPRQGRDLPLHRLPNRFCLRTVVPTEENSFRLLSRTPTVYVKVGESGNKREQTFCPDCGAPIYSDPIGSRAAMRASASHRTDRRREDGVLARLDVRL
ncbi:GFA family protein [Bradyrhizobium sp. sGM-13]|uniref:GFA family protein n=1 Tax=Bradyrhizobium sp. sGM-13 TaxID=2831781 RepID=UPI001BCBC601